MATFHNDTHEDLSHFGDHNDPLRSFQDHADEHVDAKLAEIAFHRATVESYLTF